MAAPYTKTSWIEDVTKTDPTNLANMENGIYLASAPIVTSLPGSPVNGQEVNYLADATNGVTWHLVYVGSLGKWVCTGGTPLHAEIANGGNGTGGLAANTYGDPAAPGPSLVAPLAGDYLLTFGFYCYFSNIGNANPVGMMSPQIGATAAIDQDCVIAAPGFTVPAGQQHMHNEARTIKKTGVAAGTTILMKHKWQNASPVLVDNRFFDLMPVKVG